jgi:twinkle protein
MSRVETQGPCPFPGCGSSDAFTLYDDGHGYCFSCRGYQPSKQPSPTDPMSAPSLLPIDYDAWDSRPKARRGISAATCRKYGYGYVESREGEAQAATYFDAQGRPVAQKLRLKKGADGKKRMAWAGDASKAVLFGQQLLGEGGRMVVITEGEIDAMSVYEASGRKYPAVSIRSGASGAVRDCSAVLEWLCSFDRVVLMFDMDDPGRQAAQEVAALLPPGKAYIASLSAKDANEVLQQSGFAALSRAVWEAQPWRPDGLVSGEALKEHLTRPMPKGVPLPHGGLQLKLRGVRPGELWMFGAGSGAGKSSLCRELAAHYAQNHGWKVGYVALEESVQRALLGVLSVFTERRLHLEDELDTEDLWSRYGGFLSDHFVFYDHFGSVEAEGLLSKLRYLAVAEKVDLIVLDHVSIAVSGLETDNERRAIDMLMTRLRSMVEETRCSMFVVSHLKRVVGKAFESGGEVGMSDFRGSAALEQLSDVMIGQERDLQAEGDQRNFTHLRVIKNRPVGDTGPAGWMYFDPYTGRLQECEPPESDVSAVLTGGLEEVPF